MLMSASNGESWRWETKRSNEASTESREVSEPIRLPDSSSTAAAAPRSGSIAVPSSSSTRRLRAVQLGAKPCCGCPTNVAARAISLDDRGMSGPRRPWGPPLPSQRSYW